MLPHSAINDDARWAVFVLFKLTPQLVKLPVDLLTLHVSQLEKTESQDTQWTQASLVWFTTRPTTTRLRHVSTADDAFVSFGR
ncbi:Hypothetical protein NTJ_06385 [Nesidiocoris tenuis]|uniref:Uncharacterized protein n=1 Tax=Nesidiocoris tenuis TaxID=355587 RepID=A0ABN7AMY3_9HEMI|nr:Hypothetical protein NTJ_06385 [Nesidiocoris tenuis]